MRPFIYIVFLLSAFSSALNIIHGQDTVNIHVRNTFKLEKQLLPSALIISGLILMPQDPKKDLQDAIPGTDTEIDNYLQWAPIGLMYTADIFTHSHKNNVFNQSKYLSISLLATAGITQLLKKLTHVSRPNGGTLSFPSGHTSNAFSGATVLFHEYRDYNLLIAGSGYLFSTATGALRVTNNAHWVPDVLVGAGIGIIVTNLVYYLEPLKNWDPFNFSKNQNITFLPKIDFDRNVYCISINIRLDAK
jgi:hypothetical protein